MPKTRRPRPTRPSKGTASTESELDKYKDPGFGTDDNSTAGPTTEILRASGETKKPLESLLGNDGKALNSQLLEK